MTVLSTAAGASLLAHGLHITMVLAGLWGLAALLLPHALERRTGHREPLDAHEARVRQLRAAAAAGTLATPVTGAPTALLDRPTEPPARGDAARLGLPLAVVASAAAGGIHAAVAAPHLAERVLFGVFFLVCALAQVGWAAALLHRPSRALLELGVVGNAAVLALWLVTRTVGLPWGLLPQPEELGGWDLTCAAWEVALIGAAAWVLRDGVPRRCPTWFAWHPAARGALGLAGVSLALLSLMAGHS